MTIIGSAAHTFHSAAMFTIACEIEVEYHRICRDPARRRRIAFKLQKMRAEYQRHKEAMRGVNSPYSALADTLNRQAARLEPKG